jgi:hypothetical protein
MQKTAWHGTFAVAWEYRKRDAIPMCELRPRDLSCKGKFRTRLQRERNSIGRKCQRGTAANSCSHSTVAVQVALRRDFGTLRVIHSHLHIIQMKKNRGRDRLDLSAQRNLNCSSTFPAPRENARSPQSRNQLLAACSTTGICKKCHKHKACHRHVCRCAPARTRATASRGSAPRGGR